MSYPTNKLAYLNSTLTRLISVGPPYVAAPGLSVAYLVGAAFSP
jgi:hypothetical protein